MCLPAPARRTNLGFSEFWVSGGSGRPLSGIPRPDWGNIPRRGANFIFSKGSVGFISSASYFLACIGDGLPSGRGKFCPDSDRVPIFPGREGMGAGDVKLAALAGASLGVWGWIQATVLGSLAGAAVGLGLILTRRATWKTPLPFGAFLALAAIAVLFGIGIGRPP